MIKTPFHVLPPTREFANGKVKKYSFFVRGEQRKAVFLSVIAKKGALTLSQSVRTVGYAPTSGKKWGSWKTEYSYTFRVRENKQGVKTLDLFEFHGNSKNRRKRVRNISKTFPSLLNDHRGHQPFLFFAPESDGELYVLECLSEAEFNEHKAHLVNSFSNVGGNSLKEWLGQQQENSHVFPPVDVCSQEDCSWLLKYNYGFYTNFTDLDAYRFFAYKAWELLKSEFPSLVEEYSGESLGNILLRAMFPAFKYYDLEYVLKNRMEVLPSALRYDTSDTRDFIKNALGSSFVRKDVIRTVGSAQSFKELLYFDNCKYVSASVIPVDWKVSLWEKNSGGGTSYAMISLFKQRLIVKSLQALNVLLRYLPESKRKRLWFERNKPWLWKILVDTLHMFEEALDLLADEKTTIDDYIDFSTIQKWEDLHDRLSVVTKNLTFQKKNKALMKGFKLTDFEKSLNHTVFTYENDLYEVVAPENPKMLFDWGNKMSNCVGSYAIQVFSHQTMVLGLTKHGQIIVNVEIQDDTIQQFYGKYNSKMNSSLERAFISHVEKKTKKKLQVFDEHPDLVMW